MGGKYPAGTVSKSFLKMTGGARPKLSETKPDLILPCLSISPALEGGFLKTCEARENPEKDFDLASVVQATAAAPTYFPPCTVKNETQTYVGVDGGVVLKNPCFYAYMEGMRILQREDKKVGKELPLMEYCNRVFVVAIERSLEDESDKEQFSSIGAGGKLQWVLKGGIIISDFQKGQRFALDAGLSGAFEENIYRLSFGIGNVPLDDSSPQTFCTIGRKIEAQFGEDNKIFNVVCKHIADRQ